MTKMAKLKYAITESPRYLLYAWLGLVFITINAIRRENGSPIIGIKAVLINPKFIHNRPIM